MAKQVRETAAGSSIGAVVILKGRRHVATVQLHYGNSVVTADCWQGDEKARAATAKALGMTREQFANAEPQQGRAGGYGYDKRTAAIAGLVIDGIPLTDHCGGSLKPPRGRRNFPQGYKPRKGYRLANWQAASDDNTRAAQAALDAAYAANDSDAVYAAKCDLIDAQRSGESAGYMSCYRLEGFGYLEALGYTVIRAI